jgi:hypothetical protein
LTVLYSLNFWFYFLLLRPPSGFSPKLDFYKTARSFFQKNIYFLLGGITEQNKKREPPDAGTVERRRSVESAAAMTTIIEQQRVYLDEVHRVTVNRSPGEALGLTVKVEGECVVVSRIIEGRVVIINISKWLKMFQKLFLNFVKAVLGIRSRIRKICMFLGLADPDPLVRGKDLDPDLSFFS